MHSKLHKMIFCICGLILLMQSAKADQYGNLLYSSDGSAITITGFTTMTSGDNFIIPLTINGLPVTRIGESAFSAGAYWNVRSVSIGDNVTNIGNFAFAGCNYMSSVTLGSKVAAIGGQAFSGCSALKQITIPGSLTHIWYDTFEYCTGLTNVTINSSISIDAEAFYSCENLTSVMVGVGVGSLSMGGAFADCNKLTTITVDAQNSNYSSQDGILFNKNKTVLIVCPPGKGNYTIPFSVTNIVMGAFFGCTKLTGIIIPNSVTGLGNSVFYGCTNLAGVTIGANVTNIGSSTFERCSKLTNITIPNNVTNIGDSAFENCTGLTNLTIGAGVTSIGESAFDSCTSLVNITLPSSVNFIDLFAFQNCQALASVYFQGDAPSLSSRHMWTSSSAGGGTQYFDGTNSVFYGDNNLTGYYFPGTAGWDATFCNRPMALWLTVNDGVAGGPYTNLQQVSISANPPDVGKIFDRWTGATQYVANVTSSKTTIAVPSHAIALTATYKDDYYTLTVVGGTGGGEYTYQQQANIIAAAPLVGKMFDRWLGDTQHVANSTSLNTTVTMPAQAITLTAMYKDIYTLTVISGAGGGTTYTNQQQIAIAANAPAVGKTFDRWTGDIQHVASATSSNTSVTMPASNITVNATYSDILYMLTVNGGSGGGAAYTNGQQVVITANTPAVGKTFDRWTGATQYVVSVTLSNTTVTMPSQSITLTATYADLPQFLVVVSAQTNGVVSPSGEVTVFQGESLSITADPDHGYKVKHWLVNDEVTAKGQKELTVEITEPTTIRVFFEKIKAMPWLNLLLE